MKSNLDWIIDNKTVPSQVTKALQMIADKHHLSVLGKILSEYPVLY
jgi:F0F1-type ATP synthase delta subunit